MTLKLYFDLTDCTSDFMDDKYGIPDIQKTHPQVSLME
jgi:hypothetical protein